MLHEKSADAASALSEGLDYHPPALGRHEAGEIASKLSDGAYEIGLAADYNRLIDWDVFVQYSAESRQKAKINLDVLEGLPEDELPTSEEEDNPQYDCPEECRPEVCRE